MASRSSEIFALLLVPAMSLMLLAQQADRARTEALARRATERLQALQKEADRLASEERTLLGDLRKLEVERQIKAEELRQIVADGAQIAGELTANRRRMQDLEQQESSSRPELRARLVDIYKLGTGPIPAPAALDLGSPSGGTGVAHSGRAGQAGRRSHRHAPTHARRAEENPRRPRTARPPSQHAQGGGRARAGGARARGRRRAAISSATSTAAAT